MTYFLRCSGRQRCRVGKLKGGSKAEVLILQDDSLLRVPREARADAASWGSWAYRWAVPPAHSRVDGRSLCSLQRSEFLGQIKRLQADCDTCCRAFNPGVLADTARSGFAEIAPNVRLLPGMALIKEEEHQAGHNHLACCI